MKFNKLRSIAHNVDPLRKQFEPGNMNERLSFRSTKRELPNLRVFSVIIIC